MNVCIGFLVTISSFDVQHMFCVLCFVSETFRAMNLTWTHWKGSPSEVDVQCTYIVKQKQIFWMRKKFIGCFPFEIHSLAMYVEAYAMKAKLTTRVQKGWEKRSHKIINTLSMSMSIVHETPLYNIKCSKHVPIPAKKIGHQIFYSTTTHYKLLMCECSSTEPMDNFSTMFRHILRWRGRCRCCSVGFLVLVSLAKVCSFINYW